MRSFFVIIIIIVCHEDLTIASAGYCLSLHQQTVNLACHEALTIALVGYRLSNDHNSLVCHTLPLYSIVFIKIHKIFHIQATLN